MDRNVGPEDRVVRIVVGIALGVIVYLGYLEGTAGIVADRVAALGFDVRRGVGRTGVVAELRNGDGPVVALRADMDALPIQEANEVDYASTVPGVMHACGHDAHVAGLIGAARLMVECRDRGELPPGTDDRALAARARTAGLGPLALSELRYGGDGPPGLVLGYAAQTPDELTAAVAVLASQL